MHHYTSQAPEGVAVTSEFTVRCYVPGDETAIVELFERVFGAAMSLEQWHWKYVQSGDERVHAQVAEAPDGRLIGHAGAVALLGTFDGRPIPFFQIADVMVDPAARGGLGRQNVFAGLARALFERLGASGEAVFAYGFPGTGPFTVGRYYRVYESIERTADRILPLGPLRRHWNFYSVQPLDWNDNRIDRLWQRVGPALGLTVKRDCAYLSWRYEHNPYRRYRLLGITRLRRLQALAVLHGEGSEIALIDLLTSPAEIREVFGALGRFLFREGSTALRFWLPERFAGPWSESCACRPSEAVVTNMVWHLPVATATARKRLFYTMGDADVF